MKSCVATIAKAIRDHGDNIVLRLVYRDASGVSKRRYVSPYNFCSAADEAFEGLCLTSGELRRFNVANCSEVTEVPAHEVLIPMPMEVIETKEEAHANATGQ